MKHHMLYSVAAAALMIPAVMAPTSVHAQQITAGVQGTVVDDNGTPVSNAQIVVTDGRTNASRTLTTGTDGSFRAEGLTTGGPYTIAANADGFEGQTLENVNLSISGNVSLTFTLSSGEGEIVVTGTRARLTQLAVGPGTAFGTEVLQNAPTFNRDVRDIIRIDPRVSLDRDDGGSGQDRISCLGGNDRGNAFTVDGIPQGDIYGLNDTGFSARSSTPLPYDAIRETSVQFAPFDVEYGQFTGCAINVVTSSGSNRFTGSAFFEYSDSNMRGDRVADRPVPPIEPEKRYGFSLGGPIIPDRLFFFGAYEYSEAGLSQDEGPAGAGFATELAGVPVAAFNEISDVLSSVYGIETGPLVTSRPSTNERIFGRVDWQINDRHRLEATYQRLDESTLRPDDFFTNVNTPQVTGANTFTVSGTLSNYYSARLYSTWSDVFSTEFRYSRSEIQDRQDPLGGGEAQSANPIPRIIVGIDNASGPDGTVLAGPGNSRSANDLRTKLDQYRALARINAGAHQIKMGFEVNHADLFNLFVQNATGTLVFENVNDLRAGLLSRGLIRSTGAPGNPCPTSLTTTTTPINVVNGCTVGAFGNFSATGDVNAAAAEFTRTIYSAYIQDDWRVSDRLSLVLGVRTDWYDGGRPAQNPNFVERYGFGNNIGFTRLDPVVLPRFGFTYEMNDFAFLSRSTVKGGVGIFGGGDPLVWFGNAFQNDGRGFAQGTSADAACGGTRIDVVQNGQFTGLPTCFQQSASNIAAGGLGDTQSISPNIKLPTVLRANIGLQTELGFADTGFFSGWSVNLDYIYSQYRNPFGLVDLSQIVNPARGLNGFTSDGRPIYAAIDPTVAGCNAELTGLNPGPVFSGVTQACFGTQRDDELQLTNTDGFRSHNASFILSKNFNGIFSDAGSTFFTLGYAFTDAQDRRNMYNSTAGSNFDLSAAFDRQNPDASRGFFSSKHNITLQTTFREQFFADLSTSFGFTFVARSGRPYSLTFTGGGVFADSVSGNDNALAYIPTGANDPNVSPTSTAGVAQQVADFAQGLKCARDYIGRSIERNTCSNDWYYDLDLTLSQELPGPGRLFGVNDRIRVFATFDNFLNFLDRNWNVQRRRNFAGLQDIAGISGVDAQGRYVFTNFIGDQGFADDNTINISSSVWRVKVGASYRF